MARETNDGWRRGKLIMDDDHGNHGFPAGGSEQSSAESHPPTSIHAETSDSASTQTLAIPSNGSSQRKIEANRRNAQKSTGPKTSAGKATSSWNSTQHGLLSKRLPETMGQGRKQYGHLLASLQRDLEPVGTLEQLLVEKIAQEYWRLGIAAWHEADEFTRSRPFAGMPISRILRYQTTINRQLFQAMNHLERLQRLRKGDNVPAPLTVQVSHETPTRSEEERLEQ